MENRVNSIWNVQILILNGWKKESKENKVWFSSMKNK